MSHARRRGALGRFAASGAIVATAFVAVGSATATAGTPTSILHDQMLVKRLSHLLRVEEQKSAQLGTEYDTDISNLAAINHKITQYEADAAEKQSAEKITHRKYVNAVIRSYVDGISSGQGSTFFGANVNQAQAQAIYQDEVIGNLNQLEATLSRQHRSLEATLSDESHQKSLASRAAAQAHNLAVQNQLDETQTRVTLHRVTAQLAAEIISYEVSVATAAAWRHDAAAIQSAEETAASVGGQPAANEVAQAVAKVYAEQRQRRRVHGTPAGSHQALRAVHAAEGQIGVPYVWGGESPGHGFDCSGLTQWSWGQAGVSIPRTAAEQYYSMVHVPLTDLRAGDLLFYYNLDGDHEVDHVVMYVGQGPYGNQTIIAAAYTGTNIGYEQLFTYGLIGAGRP